MLSARGAEVMYVEIVIYAVKVEHGRKIRLRFIFFIHDCLFFYFSDCSGLLFFVYYKAAHDATISCQMDLKK